MKKESKFLKIIKWTSLGLAILFSLVSCGESLLSSLKTQEQVDHFVDGDLIDTSKYVPLKNFEINIENKREDGVYYVGQKLNYDVKYFPMNASYKALSYDINDPELASIDVETKQITCLKPGIVKIDFKVLNEEKLGTRELKFEIKKLKFNKFDILDENGNICNNKDVIFNKVTDKPKIYKIDTDSVIARDLLLNISVGDTKIANVSKNEDTLKITPISEGRTTITLKIDDLEIKLYVSTISLKLVNARHKGNGTISITNGKDYIFNTIYFSCDDTRALDHERIVVDFQDDSYFELADYRSGIITGRNEFFVNIRYKESKYDEVSAMPEGTIITEYVKVRYVYPGGTEVDLNIDRNGNDIGHFTLIATTVPSLSLENYSYIPDEVNFAYLTNNKGEIYHQEYFQDLITKVPYDDHNMEKVNHYYSEFEIIEGNKLDFNFDNSTFYRLVMTLNENVVPQSRYVIRFYFNKFHREKFKDIVVNFEKITKIPEISRVFADFRNIYGELDKTKSGKIPENITHSSSLNEHIFMHYEFVDQNKNIIPAFKSGGIILDKSIIDNSKYNCIELSSNDANYSYGFRLRNREKIVKDNLVIRVTSPIFDFFGKERQWSEFKLTIDDSPRTMEYKINKKTVQLVNSNEDSPIYEYDKELNVGDKLLLTFEGKSNKYNDFSGKNIDSKTYKAFEESVYDGATYPNIKNRYECSPGLPSGFSSLFPIDYKISNEDVANFSTTQIIMKYPGETVLTFKNGYNYGDHYEFEFKIKVKVNGEQNPINVHDLKIKSFNELEYCKNDLENGFMRLGSSIKIDKSMFDENLFNENVVVEVSNPSIFKLDKNTNEIKAIKVGKATISARLKNFNHVVQNFNLTVTNTTSPFEIVKSDFIDLKQNNGELSLVGYVNKEYNIKIKPLENTSSKYIKVEEVSDENLLEIENSNIIKTDKGGKTKIRVTYGNKSFGEQEFIQEINLEIIDNSSHYNGIVYFTRKFVGHFGLNAGIAICLTTFLILVFYKKKKLNYLIAPIALSYGAIISVTSELIQGLVPTRDCVPNDMWINFQGHLFGVVLTIIIYLIVILVLYLKNKSNKKAE